LAAKYLEPTLVRLLADAGGDILLPLDDGTTALMAAVGLGSSRSTTRRNRLIAPELVAAEWNNGAQVLATVQAVLDAGAKVTLDAVGRSGNTALHAAARNRFSAAADLLLASGANADIRNENGTTARELVDRLKPN
jgi:ankyrin repeat protein